jgi:dTDP-4-dehydrorhamnose reductase
MKILLFGKNGQIGKSLYKTLKEKHDVLAVGRKECDLTKEKEIFRLFSNLNVHLVINAAAYTDVDSAENNSEEAFLVNCNALKLISKITEEMCIPIISYSTDYVFDGKKKGEYKENSLTKPINIYGQTKLLGEENLKLNSKHIIIRTSRVYSIYGNNFIKKILLLAEKNSELKVVSDQFGTPTSSDFISIVTSRLIDYMLNDNFNYGIYHLTAKGSCSWYEYARLIIDVALKNGHNLKTDLNKIYSVSSKDFKSNASRPKNSVLSTKKIQSLLSVEIPNWKNDVRKITNDIINKS